MDKNKEIIDNVYSILFSDDGDLSGHELRIKPKLKQIIDLNLVEKYISNNYISAEPDTLKDKRLAYLNFFFKHNPTEVSLVANLLQPTKQDAAPTYAAAADDDTPTYAAAAPTYAAPAADDTAAPAADDDTPTYAPTYAAAAPTYAAPAADDTAAPAADDDTPTYAPTYAAADSQRIRNIPPSDNQKTRVLIEALRASTIYDPNKNEVISMLESTPEMLEFRDDKLVLVHSYYSKASQFLTRDKIICDKSKKVVDFLNKYYNNTKIVRLTDKLQNKCLQSKITSENMLETTFYRNSDKEFDRAPNKFLQVMGGSKSRRRHHRHRKPARKTRRKRGGRRTRSYAKRRCASKSHKRRR